MNKEELEKDYYADRPTEPYSNDDSPNDWANIAHYAEENLEKAFKQISELEAENEQIKNSDTLCKLIGEQKRKITELEQQIEKIKQELDTAREEANRQEQWELYSVLNGIYNDNFEVITSVSN